MSRTYRRNWDFEPGHRRDKSCPSTCICKMGTKRQRGASRVPTRQEIAAIDEVR